jgi:hypothetical protein
MNEFVQKFADHLAFFGYTKDNRSENERLILSGGSTPNTLLLREIAGGIHFSAAYPGDEIGATVDKVNTVNSKSWLVKVVYVDSTTVTVESWYPGVYDKQSFGLFFDFFRRELDKALQGIAAQEVSTLPQPIDSTTQDASQREE